MAKIHTVEWTPAIIAHPTTRFGMRANWYGILGKRLSGSRSRQEVLGGIPGSAPDHHGVPYSLTEEFVAVYRMHPLIPDDFTFRSVETDEVLAERTFRELGALDVRKRLEESRIPKAPSTRSASRTRARSRCTTTRASCRSSDGRTGR